jgi:hypothetical protein
MGWLPIVVLWTMLLWSYIASALAVVFWLRVLRRQLEGKLAYAVLAFIACLVTNNLVDLGAYYVIPLDVAGTPPPDPRNAHLRFLIVAAVQLPVAFFVAYLVALRYRGSFNRP